MVFTGVDVGVAVLVLISAILATARGFTREILSLATWAGAAAIAAYMYFYHKDIAETYIDNPLVATGVTVVGTFLVALIVLHLLTMWIGDMVVDSRIGPLDRTLGFLFGAARGVLICIVAAVFANFLLAPKLPDMVANAKSYPPLLSAGDWLITLLPDDIEKQFTDFLQKRNQNPNDTGPNDTTSNDDTDNGDSTQPPADVSSSEAAPAA
ncbi:MAG: CvpA family protein [Devosia sp.]|jgi:membrane protein required for colicin V production|nr:CvpA family protein [Devosia sp.]